MTDTPLPDHQTLEDAFQPAKDVLKRLPEDTTEAKRAAHHLKLAEDYAHETRDRTKTDRVTPPLDASVEMRGPAVSGWPFGSAATQWTWNDGTAP